MSQTPKSMGEVSLIRQVFTQDQLQNLAKIAPGPNSATHVELEDSLRTMNRRFDKLPLKSKVIEMYTNNRIYLLTNKETVKVPSLLPVWRVGTDRGVAAYVNAVPYVPAGGPGDIDVRRLFGLMSMGAVMVLSYNLWPKFAASMPLAKAGAAVYSRMMFKVVDRLTGVGMDRLRSDQIKYLFAKYFLCGMMKRPPSETTTAVAMSVATLGSSRSALEIFETNLAGIAGAGSQDELYNRELTDFLNLISQAAPWTAKMTVRAFIQNFTSMYTPPALLAAEDPSYFFAIVSSHQAGADMISSYSFDPVYGNDGDDIVAEIARLA